VQSAQRDEDDVGDPEPGREVEHRADDLVEGIFGVAREIHLVDGDDDVADAEQRRDRQVPAGLLGHPVADVDEHERELGGRRAR
jgi:hypothetical protein